jgi:exodeoxyribonuclease VII small subunit
MPRKTTDRQDVDAASGEPQPVDFEQSLAALEALVGQLEGGDLPLEKALEAFERGVRLTRECQQALREAEQKVAILSGNGDDARAVAFDTDGD